MAGSKPKQAWGLLLTIFLCPNMGEAQNTDSELRVNFHQFTLALMPSNVISCRDNGSTAETVRNVAEDCLQAFAPNSCKGLFQEAVGLPEQILLGGAACRDDDTVLVFGGAMDFMAQGAAQEKVNECVLETFGSAQCLAFFQNLYPELTSLEYSVDTPKPTEAPSATPSSSPTNTPTSKPSWAPTPLPSAKPSASPTGVATASPSDHPSLRPSNSPSAAPSISAAPSGEDAVKGGIQAGENNQKQSSGGGNSIGIYIGAVACGLCLLLLVFLFVSKRRRRVEEETKDASLEIREVTAKDTKEGGLHSLDSLHPQPVPPPPGILHNNSPHTGARAQSRLFHSLPDDDYSAPGTSIGDPDLSLIASVDMGSTDGSESFVDHNRSLTVNISKDMLGGSSEVPRNRNAVLSRLGATLTPALILSSSSDDGDTPPSPPAQKKTTGFRRMRTDEEDGTDEELLLEIPPQPANPEDFAPDTEWDPDDSEVGAGAEDVNDMFKDRRSPVSVDDPEADVKLPMPPELKNNTRRKPRSGTPRNVLGGSGRRSPAVGGSLSSGSSG